MREHGRIDHQQFAARTRFAAQQQPTESCFAVDLQEDARQLAVRMDIEDRTAQRFDSGLGPLRRHGIEMNRRIDPNLTTRYGLRQPFESPTQVLADRLDILFGILRQFQMTIIVVALRLPDVVGNQQRRPTAECKTVFDKDRAVTQRDPQRRQGRPFEREQRLHTVIARHDPPPGTTDRHFHIVRQFTFAANVDCPQHLQRICNRMRCFGCKWQRQQFRKHRARDALFGQQLRAHQARATRTALRERRVSQLHEAFDQRVVRQGDVGRERLDRRREIA